MVTAAAAVLLYYGAEALNVVRNLVYSRGSNTKILKSEATSEMCSETFGLGQQQSNNMEVSSHHIAVM